MCDAVAHQQQCEKIYENMGFCGPCAAGRNGAGGSMDLALWPWPVATTFQMRRGEYNNAINSSWVPISQVDGQREAFVRRGVLRVHCKVYNINHRIRCNRYVRLPSRCGAGNTTTQGIMGGCQSPR